MRVTYSELSESVMIHDSLEGRWDESLLRMKLKVGA